MLVKSSVRSTRVSATSWEWKTDSAAQNHQAEVPLSEMFGYATELRSATQRQRRVYHGFKHYSQVSDAYMKKILGRYNG